MNVHHAICVIFTVDNVTIVSTFCWLPGWINLLSPFLSLLTLGQKQKVVLVKVCVFGLYNPEKHVYGTQEGMLCISERFGGCVYIKCG
jgi:hypothetical protein